MRRAVPVVTAAPAIALAGISKRFGAVQANEAVDLTVEAGTIHGIIGENGAGKSTLVSILAGHYTADAGTISLFGEEVRLASSADAIRHGIGMVHQHFMLVPNFTVLENMMLGLAKAPLLSASRDDVLGRMAAIRKAYGIDLDPDAVVEDLPVGLQQRVEIVKALVGGGRILILDEPTGVLTPDETDRLFESLRVLKAKGVTILLITHKLREIMAVTDNVAVMRRGRMVAHTRTADTSREALAAAMVGREVRAVRNATPPRLGPVALSVEHLSVADQSGTPRLSDVSFTLRSGEILGVAGVAGNGQSELLAALAGLVPPSGGRFSVGGRTVSAEAPADPGQMRALGIAHVPEDRRREGLVMPFEMGENAVLGYLGKATERRWLLKRRRMLSRCQELMDRFDGARRDPRLRSRQLFSGGQQQKLCDQRTRTEHGARFLKVLLAVPGAARDRDRLVSGGAVRQSERFEQFIPPRRSRHLRDGGLPILQWFSWSSTRSSPCPTASMVV